MPRSRAADLDAADPLAGFRDRFAPLDPGLIYLDGNSLGMLPAVTARRLADVIRQDWGTTLIRSWAHWMDLPGQVGDLLGEHLLGAGPGQVTVCDSTTVNLYKLACAAVDARPGRPVLVTDDDNFPTDRYVLAGIAARSGGQLRLIRTDPDQGIRPDDVRAAIGPDTALVCLSHVAYRSGALADMAAITRLAHEAGALVLWDLCHSAGSVPVDLDGCGADLAVGCTYKYLNAGPGAPAFLYVRRGIQDQLTQPIQGWFGQQDQFMMGPRYEPAPGIARFSTGTPNIPGTVAVQEGTRLLAEAGIAGAARQGDPADQLPDRAGRRLAGAVGLRTRLSAGSGPARVARDPAPPGGRADQPGPDPRRGHRRLPDPGPAPARAGPDHHPVHRRLGRDGHPPPDPRDRGLGRPSPGPGATRSGRVSGLPARALGKRSSGSSGRGPERSGYSHSMVPGGLLVMSSTTRLTSGTSLVIRVEIRPSRSPGSRAQSAVMASSLVTGRSTTG